MLDIAAERLRLAGEKAKIAEQLARSQKMLANQKFVERARADVVQRERDRLKDLKAARTQLEERLTRLGG